MKSFLKLSVAAAPSPGTVFLRKSAITAFACLFASVQAFGQGAYYPVNPSGSNGAWVDYGAGFGKLPTYSGTPTTYTGINTVNSTAEMVLLQNSLGTLFPGQNYSLQTPVPGGSQATPSDKFAAAVSLAATLVLANSPSVPVSNPPVSISSLANEAVAWNTSYSGTTTTAVAQAIVQFNSATAGDNLAAVAGALAGTQPTIINSIIANIVIQAGTNTTVAAKIPKIVATAISYLPTNPSAVVPNSVTTITAIVNNGVAYGIAGSSLTAQNKADLFTGNGAYAGAGYIQSLLAATVTNNRPATIDAITSAVTFTNFLTLGNLPGGAPALTTILHSVIAGIPAGSLSDTFVMGAVAAGALRTEGSLYGGSGGAIATALDANAPTATYTDMVVNGYSNSASSGAFAVYVAAHAAFSDALAAGAVVKASLNSALVLQLALVNGTAAPKSVVASAVLANQASAMTTLVGAINTTTHTPYGTATFGDIAYGGAKAAPLATVGNVTTTVLLNSAASATALDGPTVISVVQNALNGANAGGNQPAFAALIYGTQMEAKYTSPGTVSNPGIAMVQAAVDTLTTIANPLYPSYIAVVAAVAGDTYGYNQTNIQNAGDAQLTTDAGDVVAANAGANLVSALRANTATTFTSTITAFANAALNASPANSAQAVLYGAVLKNPGEYAAELASAIKQTAQGSVSDTTFTAVTNDALLATNGLNLVANVQMVDTLVTHLRTEAQSVSGITDLFGYVGHQITDNPTLTQTIAAAATVFDPDAAHFIAHSVAFNNPASAYLSVASIFTYAQITNPHPVAVPTSVVGQQQGNALPNIPNKNIGTLGQIIDQPAAAAAITAGLTTGILEAGLSPALTKTDLINTITQAVAASATQNGTNLQGPLHPFSSSGDNTNIFQQSDGSTATWTPTSAGTVSGYKTVGAAGAITGFVAQMTNAGDSTISPITAAVLQAASGATVKIYALAIAQAAAQALRWVGGANVSTALAGPMAAGNPAFDIANAMAATVSGFATLTQLENAAAYGINAAANGVIGAGAVGLNAPGVNPGTGTFSVAANGNSNSAFYQVHSATGTPVTDIFNL